jgi:hypothetical protein
MLTVSTDKTLPVLLNDRFKSFTGLITSDDCTMVGDDTAARVSVFKFSIGANIVIVGVVIRSVDASVLWLVLRVGSHAGMFDRTSECCCLAFLITDAATPPLTLTTLLVGNLFLPVHEVNELAKLIDLLNYNKKTNQVIK